jgi:cellulose synthase/poly-beta-1,6-N-acetylglucosamine synthase-like glycosyltransferase
MRFVVVGLLMLTFFSCFLTGLAALLAVPAVVLSLEVLVALLVRPHALEGETEQSRDRIAVLIPAHNEGVGLVPTLADIKDQLRPGDRLLVVADNCTDDTAEVAASAGAEVAVRSDMRRVGKGYALDWGIDRLTADPPAIVVVVDADCRLVPGTLDRLANACALSQRPVQSLYLMTSPAGPTINHQVAEFAWRLKNWVRPLGLHAMGLPCQLMGTGMAFPWDIILSADLSSGFIVEDLKLGLELARAGHPPLFCPTAVVTSTFPTSEHGAKTQRHRWEQGHIGLILTKSPSLLFAAARRGNKDLLALTLDLLVPPITLLALLLTAMAFVAAIAALANASLYPLVISLVSALLMIVTVILAWAKYGRDILQPKSLALIGQYLLRKLSLYRAVLFGRRISRWIRTDRS